MLYNHNNNNINLTVFDYLKHPQQQTQIPRIQQNQHGQVQHSNVVEWYSSAIEKYNVL